MKAINHAIICWAFFAALCVTPKPMDFKSILPWCQPGFLYCVQVQP